MRLDICLTGGQSHTAWSCIGRWHFSVPASRSDRAAKETVWLPSSSETIQHCLAVRSVVDTNGYEYLRQLHYPLPSYRTLCGIIQSLPFAPSIQHDVLELLQHSIGYMGDGFYELPPSGSWCFPSRDMAVDTRRLPWPFLDVLREPSATLAGHTVRFMFLDPTASPDTLADQVVSTLHHQVNAARLNCRSVSQPRRWGKQQQSSTTTSQLPRQPTATWFNDDPAPHLRGLRSLETASLRAGGGTHYRSHFRLIVVLMHLQYWLHLFICNCVLI